MEGSTREGSVGSDGGVGKIRENVILVGLGISHRQSKPFIDLRIYRVSRGDSGKLNVCGVFRRHELIFELPSHSPSAPLLSRPALLLLSACGSYDFRAPAAMWEDVSLMPYETGTERKVFSVTDRFQPNFDLVSARPPLPDANSRKDWPRHEDYILEIPFDVNLPMGCATRIVDGKMETSHVPLPPSFEISSEGIKRKKKERGS